MCLMCECDDSHSLPFQFLWFTQKSVVFRNQHARNVNLMALLSRTTRVHKNTLPEKHESGSTTEAVLIQRLTLSFCSKSMLGISI